LRIIGPPGTRSIVMALIDQVYERDIAFRSQGELAIDWAPVESADVVSGLVHDGGTWRVFAESVVHGHGLAYPEAFRRQLGVSRLPRGSRGQGRRLQRDCAATASSTSRDADVPVQRHMARAEPPPRACSAWRDHRVRRHGGSDRWEARVRKLVLTHFRPASAATIQSIATDVTRDTRARSCSARISWRSRCRRAGQSGW
jgi:ribonuclease Z